MDRDMFPLRTYVNMVKERLVSLNAGNSLYLCTVHFVVYLSNTPTNAHIYSLII